jgi:flagellar protein FliO/FliZ
LKRIALVLCALAALGAGTVSFAQGALPTPRAGAAGAVGTAQAVDETALAIEDRAAAPAAGVSSAGPNTLTYFIRMVVVLALVLCAIYLVFRLMKRLSRPKAGDEASIKVLASTGLGAGKALHVVALGSKAYLIGAAESSISLISEIEDREYVDALTLRAATAPRGGKQGFAELLGSMLGGRGRKSSGRGASDFLSGQRERLRKF